jgi:hypothetical protein
VGEKAKRSKAGMAWDFLELGANAFVSGLVAAIILSVVALALATSAQAADVPACFRASPADEAIPDEPKAAEAYDGDEAPPAAYREAVELCGVTNIPVAAITPAVRETEPWSAALASSQRNADDASALWAMFLGLLALSTAGIVAVIGQTIPARRSA